MNDRLAVSSPAIPTGLPGSRSSTVSDVLVAHLASLGVEWGFGLLGGAGLAFHDALARSTIQVVHCRHEAGAAFAATEAYFATDRPALVFATTGPGLTNAITGLAAAKRDGAQVVVVSAATGSSARGRWAFQETSTMTMAGMGLLEPSGLFDYAVRMDGPSELDVVLSRLSNGVSRPHGFVAHLALPTDVQLAIAELRPLDHHLHFPAGVDPDTLDTVAELLESGSFAIWIGFGARRAAAEILRLAESSGAPVMCSPRGKGIFPASHPQFLGVTGFGGHARVRDHLARHRPDRVLVLGTRLGEMTSFWDPGYAPRHAFVHVDLDPDIAGSAYPKVPTVGVQAEIGAFCGRLADRLERARSPHRPCLHAPSPSPTPRPGRVRPSLLMHVLQRVVVDDSDATVLTEAGNSFVWGNHSLAFDEPYRYRVSTGFGAMGHATTGVVGAALASGRKAVAVVGDGAMLMNSEVSTAVDHGVDAVWVVLNDARFGLVDDGMRELGYGPARLGIPPADFAEIARGMGADGIRVTSELELAQALRLAMQARGPFVVDVIVDPSEKAPFGDRNASLLQQTGGNG